ncbi:hypothetical protein H8Z76_01270 [Roseburia sp. BX0805]|uniref:Uncharacterized protein n=1 Tax=Roseburia yibonii TaxID=2763063 RepID=A0ABR7I703_9FIRM|nr:hypothetical protein [Roseburia yibonii]MBC5752665.1 hypothetical protein [Roseburia yibonii]
MKQLTRGIIYLAGLAILALGITLNTKTGLGVSPIIAVSELWGTDFGNTVLQIPLSIVFTRFMNLYVAVIPNFATDCKGTFPGTFAGRMLFLLIAVCLTGIVQTISDVSGKEVGRVIALFQHLFLKKIQEVFPYAA